MFVMGIVALILVGNYGNSVMVIIAVTPEFWRYGKFENALENIFGLSPLTNESARYNPGVYGFPPTWLLSLNGFLCALLCASRPVFCARVVPR